MTVNPIHIPLIHFQGKNIHDALRFSHQAMATIFEIFIIHDDEDYAQQAAHEAFQRLDQLEQDLSRFIENSDISRINRSPVDLAVRVGLDTFECLKKSVNLAEMTSHGFDVTAGSVQGKFEISNLLVLDEDRFEVYCLTQDTIIDLGGIGKGFAVDQMAAVLKEWEIESVLIHGGTSTALAMNVPPEENGWPVTLSRSTDQLSEKIKQPIDTEAFGKLNQSSREILITLHLKYYSLSGSGVEKGFHIIDPRTGKQVKGRIAAWALAPDAATSDALSTAFMVMTSQEIHGLCDKHSGIGAMIIEKDGSVFKYGEWGI